MKKSESDVFGSSRLLTAGELRRQREQKRRQERKRGYCECCHVKYEDLDKVTYFAAAQANREISRNLATIFVAPACSRVRHRRPLFRPSVHPFVNIYVEVRHLCPT